MSEKNRDFGNEERDEPEIWDEYRWEQFFREADKRTDKYILLLEQYMDHPDRDRIIAEQMGWTHLLEDNDDENEEWLDEFDMDEVEEGDAWKHLTGYDYEPTDFDQFEDLPLYQKAHDFAVEAKKMLNKYFADRDDESIQTFSR